MKATQQIKEVKETKYEVTFGPKDNINREKKIFTDETVAMDFFTKKDKAGFHVDAYEIEKTIITKTKKLSK